MRRAMQILPCIYRIPETFPLMILGIPVLRNIAMEYIGELLDVLRSRQQREKSLREREEDGEH